MQVIKNSKVLKELLLFILFITAIPLSIAILTTFTKVSLPFTIVYFFLTLLFVMTPVMVWMYIKIIKPVEDFCKGTSEIIDGNLDYSFSSGGSSYFNALGNNLNLMLKTIKEQQLTLEELSFTDHLTGLANRRRLDEQMVYEIERYKRKGTPLSVMVCDIDDFKNVNDTYGHLLGDTVLAEMASLFITNLRKTDMAARFGGEEFVILLPDTPLPKAKVVADKLRKEVNNLRFATKDGLLDITITIGISSTEQFDELMARELETIEEPKIFLLEQADQALYRGKSAGKNQISM
ncbi:diguanylate cyclase [Alkalicella caledoniensis]|uniref:Diguanylate cyclase n=1 Tax=Alkalicella caledoniensis TaxID=2731377 RepID=A0A7G9WAB1_ALKCA|nr:GGDEF domain-containing protein [Alkalicella caledoniensis]QNO15623.1 diguanylate cyclase [Alkalicella caledoniensis]